MRSNVLRLPTAPQPAATAEAVPSPSRELGRPWTLTSAAKWLQVSEKTVRRAIKAGRLKTVDGIGSRILIADSSLRKFADPGPDAQESALPPRRDEVST